MQHVDYLFIQPSATAWQEAFQAGQTSEVQSRYFLPKPVEELYDTENDYWEVNNLADDPAYADVLNRMRKALDDWRMEIRDGGMIPETEYEALAGERSLYDYLRSDDCPFEELIAASDLAVMGGPEDLATFVEYVRHENSAMRYWGVTGLLLLKEEARPALEVLNLASMDEAGAVATIAAEALYKMGEIESATRAYSRIFEDKEHYKLIDRYFALGSIDALDDVDPSLISVVQKLVDDLNTQMAENPIRGGARGRRPGGNEEKRAADTLSTTLGKISTTYSQGVGLRDGTEPDPGYEFGLSYDMRVARYLIQKWEVN